MVIAAPQPNGAVKQRRLLAISPPAGVREPAVTDALRALAETYADAVAEAEKAIEDNGLTIEVVRLRDRLAGMPLTDVQRLLLSVPGIPEQLFLDAIKEQLPDPDEEEPDLDEFADRIGKVLEDSLSDALTKAITSALTDPKVAGGFQDAVAAALKDAGTYAEPVEEAEPVVDGSPATDVTVETAVEAGSPPSGGAGRRTAKAAAKKVGAP